MKFLFPKKKLSSKVNNACDGELDSYDAMVLLVGRTDYFEMAENSSPAMGMALTGAVCSV